MIQGYHVIFGAYGFWLPNDPRGSWSEFVGAWDLVRFGKAIKTNVRHSAAGKTTQSIITKKRRKKALKYPPVKIPPACKPERSATALAGSLKKNETRIWACSILPDHVHLVIAPCHIKIEQFINLLKGQATRQLIVEGCHPLDEYHTDKNKPKAWADGQWKVYLNSQADIRRAISYVEDNPLKENKPRQKCSFVTPYE